MLRRSVAITWTLAWSIAVGSSACAGQEAPTQERQAHKVSTHRKPLEGLDGCIEEVMKRWDIPGLAIAVVNDDRVVYAKGFGVRELGKPEKVIERTLFAMASQSKAFGRTSSTRLSIG
jgi:CubicO group peptidase (beta-lactamase class C family)